MKKPLIYAAFVCGLSGLNACQDDTKELLKTIDGQWKVKSIQFTGKTSRDSTVTPSQVYLAFESCAKSANSGSPANCGLEYRVGLQTYAFTYQATDGKKTIYITPTASQDPAYQQVASVVAGSYEVLMLATTSLVLRKKSNCTVQGGTESCEYTQLTATK